MNGRTLRNALARVLDENPPSTGSMDTRTSYDFLYEAACEFVRRTHCLKSSQTITTVADQAAYDLSTDYFFLYWMNDQNEYIIQYNDGTSDYFPTFRDFGIVEYSNNTTSVSIPDNFSVIDDPTAGTVITGTTTSTGALTNEEAILTDAAATFSTTTVNVGDEVQNRTTDDSGLVMAVTDTTHLATALFDGRTNCWGSGDTYVIYPQGRKHLILDPPPSTAGHTVTVRYVQKPTPPVYSMQRAYRIDNIYVGALTKYAAWLYKYREMKPNYADPWLTYFDYQTRAAVRDTQQMTAKTSFRVNMSKRAYGDRSYR